MPISLNSSKSAVYIMSAISPRPKLPSGGTYPARRSANFFDKLLSSAQNIGLGWGDTMGRFVDELKKQALTDVTDGFVCPVIGSAPNDIKWYQTNELARSFAEKTGYTPYYMHAPAFPVSAGPQNSSQSCRAANKPGETPAVLRPGAVRRWPWGPW